MKVILVVVASYLELDVHNKTLIMSYVLSIIELWFFSIGICKNNWHKQNRMQKYDVIKIYSFRIFKFLF